MKKITETDIVNRVVGAFTQTGYLDLIKFADSLGMMVYVLQGDVAQSRGSYNAEQGTYSIYINSFEPVTKQRAQIAHEIAKFVLKDETYENSDALERAITNLSAKILMPREVFETVLEKEGISRNSPIDLSLIKKLAENFKISELIVVARLKEFGYHVSYVQS